MADVEVRYIEETIGETGMADRLEGYYELGAEVNGGWFPFLRKSASYVEHIAGINKGRAQSAKDQSASQSSSTSSSSDPSSTPTPQPGDQGAQAAQDQTTTQGDQSAA